MNKALLLSAAALVLVGCGGADGDDMNDTTDMVADDSMPMVMNASQQATAAMQDSAGNDLGTLRLTDEGGAIKVEGDLSGLSAGEHAIHIHEFGACAPTFEAAGSHWNPTSANHGRDNPQGPHLGDMPNFTATDGGTATVSLTTSGGGLHGNPMALDTDGASVVIHANADDYTSQPDGASGTKVACGVIVMQ